MRKKIIGAGGGGKGGGGSASVPVESPDSLQSKAYAQVLDLVCEGEIEGLVDGFKSIYLDGVPLQNADDSLNFSGVTVDQRVGTQDQDYIPDFPATENEVAVGLEVTDDNGGGPGSGAVVRTITNESIDAIRVRVSVPQLTFQNPSNGDLGGEEVSYRILLQSDSGGFQEVVRDTIIGKSTSKYERSYRVELTGPGPWDIKVERVSEDADSVTLQNRTFWESYTEVVDGKLRYPNSALMAIKCDASQFSSIPTRGYELKLLKVKVPSNYDPVTREYDGVWDGDFQIAWTDNPAWCFYDILTSERYGLGAFLPESLVDKWSLYTIGRYCDELVPDGFGGTEPRFTCNVYLQSREEAFKVLQDLASSFRGMSYWAGGVITATQDAPADAAHLFTQANVVDGVFNYSGSSAKARHTVALVTWNDPEDLYRQKVEYVEDDEGITRLGVIETQIVAFGCTSQSQANRVGKWLLFSERYETEVVSFRVGLDGALCRPGQIVNVADPMRAGSRRAGRVVSATTTVITVDDDVVNDGDSTLAILLPSGAVEERSVLDVAGRTITLSSALSETPQSGSVWLLSSVELEPQTFRIVSIVEAEGGMYEISAITHNPGKYDAVENDLTLEPRNTSSLTSVPAAPIGLTITETLYSVGADVRVKVTASWNAVARATSYAVQYQRDSGNIISLPQTSTNEIEVLNAEPGEYTFTVYAINSIGTRSAPATATKRVLGRANPPSQVMGFSLMPAAGTAYLSWEKSLDLDVLIGGTVRIRHTPEEITPLWRNAVDIVPALPGTATRVDAPLLPGTYMAKFVDSSGIPSVLMSSITTSVPAALALNVVETVTESPDFEGVKTDMEVSDFFGGLVLSAGTLFDDIVEDIDDVPNFDFAGGVGSSGTYDFEDHLDLGEVFTSRVTVQLMASTVDVDDTIDQRIDLMDDWTDLDGDLIDDVNAEIFLQTTLEDPTDPGAEWTAWKRFFVGEYKARAYRFQLRATSLSASHNIVVSGLAVTVDMPDRVVNLSGVVSGAGTYSVTFPDGAFKEEPSLGITAFNRVSGDYYEISNKTRSGFDIVFRNSGGTAVSRTFDVLAKGYGRQAV